MDFRRQSWCLEFLQLLSSSRLLFLRQSAVIFPSKSADIFKVIRWLKETKGIQFSFYVSSAFNVVMLSGAHKLAARGAGANMWGAQTWGATTWGRSNRIPMSYVNFWGVYLQKKSSIIVVTKTRNHPKRPKTTQNHQQNDPKPPTKLTKPTKTTQNQLQYIYLIRRFVV